GHRGPVTALAFPQDGRAIFSGSADTSILLWDTTSLSRDGVLPAVVLDQGELKAAWRELASLDAARGHRALWNMVAGIEQGVPFLGSQLYFLDPKKVERLFA